MLTLAAWLHDLDPYVLRISGDLGVRWYGLAYLAGFLAAWLIMRRLSARSLTPLSREQVTDFIFVVMLCVLVGGRLGYVLVYDRSLLGFSSSPPWWGVLAINRGGMASHGGIVGLVIGCLLTGRKLGAPPLHLMDLLALTAPIGILFGRIANFINGELLGRTIAAPGAPAPWWAVRYPQELLDAGHAPKLDPQQEIALNELLLRVAQPDDTYTQAASRLIRQVQRGASDLAQSLEPLLSARHPSQLYQALGEGLITLLVVWAVWRRPRRPGVATGVFLITYGVARFATDYFRLPDSHLAVRRPAGLTYGQWLSVGVVLAGAALLIWLARTGRGRPMGGWSRRAAEPS